VKTAVFLLLLLYQPAAAQPPRAVITGPKESRPGALVVLDATESQGLGRIWLLAVSPEETSFLAVESGLKCIFASPTPGSYTFVLVVSGVNANGGPLADMTTHTVTLIGANPPPDPKPEPKPDDTPPLTIKADRATYIYEKDTHVAPRPVVEALQKLNEQGIVATQFEQDSTTGTGQVPVQYQKSLAAAREAGLPALVVEAGGSVVRVVKNPTTLEMVMEAVK